MESTPLYDVIIVGGGVAGCATALSLNRTNPNSTFLLIDNADPESFKIGESLPAEASRLLQFLSPSIASQIIRDTQNGVHAYCTGNASIWDSPVIQETYSVMNPFGPGWHLDRAAFDECLREHVRAVCSHGGEDQARGHFLKGTFTGVSKDEEDWIVTAKSDSGELNYRSKWLVDASGRKASVANKLGASRVKTDDLLAFYVVFTSSNIDPDHRTFIEATETGWWYSSQVANHQRVVVFHTDDKDPAAKQARKEEAFLEMLNTDTQHISRIIRDYNYDLLSTPGPKWPRCTAANSSFLSSNGDSDRRWCAVGDASIAFDPLSSQGMITAMRMGCAVGIMLGKSMEPSTGSPVPPSLDTIQSQYEEAKKDYVKKKRYFYNQSMFDGGFWQRRR